MFLLNFWSGCQNLVKKLKAILPLCIPRNTPPPLSLILLDLPSATIKHREVKNFTAGHESQFRKSKFPELL